MPNQEYLDMSDEDFLKQAPPAEDTSDESEETHIEQETELTEEFTDEEGDYESEEENASESEESDYTDDEEESSEETDENEEDLEDEEDDLDELPFGTADIYKPFKANNTQIKVDTAEEALQLMKMGANYHHKMNAIKEYRPLIKTLEKAGLLGDPDKLNRLIDLDQKDPKAIAQLIKDSGIDPYDLTSQDEEESEYRPTNHAVSKESVELDDVLDEIKSSDNFERLTDLVTDVWDESSRNEILADPTDLRVLTAHMDNGMYDLIHERIEKDRMYGRLDGLTDYEAYKQTGKILAGDGAFEHLMPTQAAPTNSPQTKRTNNPDTSRQTANARKRAASSSKSSRSTKLNLNDYDPLNMSDEDYLKLVASKPFQNI